jgi:uncharacterized protein
MTALPFFLARWVRAVSALVILVAAFPASADTGVPERPTRWVTDTAGLISESTRARLDAKLEEYERSSGHQVVVWIGQTIGNLPLDDFAVKTFEAWKIGRKGADDGILMIVLAGDHKIDIEVGYGLEGRVTDAASHRIIREVMAPLLREGKADDALTAGVDAILTKIEGHAVSSGPEPKAERPRAAPPSPARWIGLALIGILLLFLFATNPTLATYFLFSVFSGGGGFGSGGFGGGGGGGGFRGGGGRSGGGGARGGW